MRPFFSMEWFAQRKKPASMLSCLVDELLHHPKKRGLWIICVPWRIAENGTVVQREMPLEFGDHGGSCKGQIGNGMAAFEAGCCSRALEHCFRMDPICYQVKILKCPNRYEGNLMRIAGRIRKGGGKGPVNRQIIFYMFKHLHGTLCIGYRCIKECGNIRSHTEYESGMWL